MSTEERNFDDYLASKAAEVAPKVLDGARTGGFSLQPFAEMVEPERGTMVSLPMSAGLNVTLEPKDLTEEQLRAALFP